MDYVKIIPCLDLEDPITSARYYNDSGADEIAYFDSKATKEGREPNIRQIREITRIVDIPLLACGGIRDVEDAKKILYAGANKVCMNSAAIANPDIVKEISEKFGRNRIIVAIDLSTKEEPVEWAQMMEEKGAGELLLIHNNHVENYVEIVNEIKNKVRIPIIISSYAIKADDMKELIEKVAELYAAFEKDAKAQAENGNKAAGTRARKASLGIEKAMKEFRKASLDAAK